MTPESFILGTKHITLAVVLAGLVTGFAAVPCRGADASAQDAILDEIRHAETYYWFGMAERGNFEAFAQGLARLTRAESLLRSADLPVKPAETLTVRIASLRQDLQRQAHLAEDTFYGTFPLVRAMTRYWFADSEGTSTYALIDNADDIAVRNGARALLAALREGLADWAGRPQLDTVFVSIPPNRDLENEAVYVFNTSPQIFVHNFHEVASALSPDQTEQFRTGTVTPAIRKKLCDALGVSDFLVVTIRRLDVSGDDHFYLARARLFNQEQDQPLVHFQNMGFGRDRRDQLLPIVLGNVALLVLAVGAYPLLGLLKRRQRMGVAETLAVPAVAFVFGRAVPWVLMPLVASIAPAPESLVQSAFWWPGAAALLLFLAPGVFYRIAASRFQRGSVAFSLDGKGGGVLVAAALGLCAYFLTSMVLVLQADAVWPLLPAILLAGMGSYVLGSALDRTDRLPPVYAVVSALLFVGLGLSLCMLSAAWLWALAAGAATCIVMARFRRRTDSPQDITDTLPTGDAPADLPGLIALADNPPYQQFETFNEALARMEPVLQGKTEWLALYGPSGCGKTATLNAIIHELKRQLDEGGRSITILAGSCTPPIDQDVSYAPFRSALTRVFDINVLAPPEEQLKAVDSALQGIFDSVVPFSSLLFPSEEGSANPAGSPRELFRSISRTIRKLAEKTTVVLFLDDAQWLDAASRELLCFLLAEFPPDGEVPLGIILAGRNESNLDELGMGGHMLSVRTTSRTQQMQILQDGLGISGDVAARIVECVGAGTREHGQLFWLFRAVIHLAGVGALEKGPGGFVLTAQFAGRGVLPALAPDTLHIYVWTGSVTLRALGVHVVAGNGCHR